MEFFAKLFDTSDFPARWRCGNWTPAHGWMHILSDIGVWAAYFAIPLVLAYFVARRRDLPFRKVFLLFVAFILLCGLTHLMEAIIFWWPAYRLAGALKLVTAVVSWVTVLALIRVAPSVLAMRAPEELEREVAARTDAERRLSEAKAELERRVEERTAALGRALEVVAEEKERLRTTLASIGDAVISTDREGYVTYLNAVAEAMTGWTKAEAVGAPLTRVFNIVNESTRQPVENPAMRALKEGVIVGLANHTVLIAKDGTERPIDDSAAPIRCKDGEIVGGVLVFRDITERHRAEALLAVQRNVLEMLTTDAPLADVLSVLAIAIEGQDPGLRCSILLPDDDGRHLRVEAGPNLPADYLMFLDGQPIEAPYGGPCGMALHTGRSVVVPDAQTDDRWPVLWHERMREHGLRACRTTPVLAADGAVLGTFAVYSRRTGDPAPSDPNILHVATRLAGIAIERKQKEAKLRASESRFRALADASERQRRLYETILTNTPDFMYVFSLDHKVLYANESLINMWGRGREGAIGKTFLEIGYEPWHAEMHDREIDQVRATRRPIRGEVPFTGTHGTRQYDYIFVPVIGADGEVEAVAGTTRDVTERQEAARRLRESEERSAFVRRSSGVGFWYCDLPFDVLQWDDLVKAHFHLPPDASVTIQTFYARIHPDDREPTRLAIERSIADRTPYNVDYRTVNPDSGAVKWVRAIGRTFYAADGTPTRFDGVTFDVTEQKLAEQALRDSETYFRSMVDSSPSMLWVTDFSGHCSYISRQWCEYTGTSLEQNLGLGWLNCVHPDDLQRAGDIFLQSNRQGVRFALDYRLRRHDGEYRWAVDVGQPRFDGTGQFIGYIGTVSDIHDRKHAEEELKDADRRKDEFLATLAHELRNPLAPIRNGLQVIRMAGTTGRVEQARAMMERQLGQMVRLVDDLLDVSRVTTGKLELRRERIELRTVIDAALETIRPVIEQAGHEFAVDVPADPIVLDGDPVRLAQVLANLLTNSAKYTNRGGHIRLTAGLEGDTAVVSVADDGIGIPPAMLGRVFDMFIQVDRTLEKTTGGLGIGLSLVKGLVEMHGGTIEARSEGEGKGSEFVVRLPVAAPAPGGTGPSNGRAEEVVAPGLRRILVVDDNADAADSLGQLLEMLGNEVRTAYDGEAGVVAAEVFRPALVLCDIGMPKMNGYDAARRIRAESWSREMVLVALTGWGQEDDRHKSAAAGFEHHLVKPVELADLMKLLAGLPTAAG